MPSKRVTMQNIADACGLSRNTVSKAFNGRGAVPPATKALILQKAAELGYGLPVDEKASVPEQSVGSIALITSNMPSDNHFGTFFVTAFTNRICRAGYTLRMFEISQEELQKRQLPPHFIPEQTAGIVAIELFDTAYLNRICTLGIPTIMVDSPAHAIIRLYPCDFISMENVASIGSVVKQLAALGARRIGFVGDRRHCGSFYERWFGFRTGMEQNSLSLDEQLCILAPDASPYDDPDWLNAQIDRMPSLPDAFICANDYLAIHLMIAIKKRGLSIPGDIMVTGFDGTPQSMMVEPALTTVQIPSTEIGHLAADTLLSRIRNPERPYSWTHVRTTPVWRESTRHEAL